jgi:uncharacterized protein involved in exopolysaccharide biosynthesis
MPEELRLIPRPIQVPAPTMRDLLAIIFRQRRLALISFLAVFLAVVLYGVLAPPYRSEMKVLVRKGRLDPVVTSTPSQAEFAREEVTEEDLNSEVELLHDDEILRAVVQNSGMLSQGRSWWNIFDNDDQRLARAVRRVGRHLTVEPTRKTTLIDVSYKCSDPVQAAKILRTLASAYLARHEQVHRPSGEFNFFDQQVTLSRQALEGAELRLMDFSRDQGVISAVSERDAALQKLSDADADDWQSQVSMAEVSQRIRALQSKLSTLPERTVTQVRNSDNSELMGKMKARLLDLELQRTGLLAKFAPSYRPVQELEQEIAEAKAFISAEDQAPIREQTSDRNPDHEWVKSELLKAQVELSALGAHATAERTLLTYYRDSAHRFGDQAIQQERLAEDLKAAEEKYLLYVNKREEARMGDALDRGGILNVAIAEQPTVPALPVLSAVSFGLIGLVSAGMLSTSLAFVTDYLNPAFRTPDEIGACLGTTVLASLPAGG